jgi:hypothetical protein
MSKREFPCPLNGIRDQYPRTRHRPPIGNALVEVPAYTTTPAHAEAAIRLPIALAPGIRRPRLTADFRRAAPAADRMPRLEKSKADRPIAGPEDLPVSASITADFRAESTSRQPRCTAPHIQPWKQSAPPDTHDIQTVTLVSVVST